MNCLNSQYQHRGLLQYPVIGLPLNTDWINVYNAVGQNMFLNRYTLFKWKRGLFIIK